WYFSLLGIERHVPLLTFVVFGVLMLSTVTFALGLRTRTSIVLMLLAIVYLKGVRDSISGDVHHRYLIPFHILLFLLFSRAGSSCSLHNRIRARAPKLEEWEASWPIKAMQVYLCFFYFWAGVAKLRVAGLSWFTQGTHLQEDLLNRSLRYGFSAGGEPAGSWLAFRLAHEPLLCTVLSIATMAFELGFPLLLLVKKARWRLLLLAGVAAFHVTNYILLNVKFLLLPLVFLIFFDLRTVLDRIRGRFPRPKPPGGAVDPEADSGSERREMLVGAHDA
ncbi:MAG: HTTM domain-containing protein, partial [Planctomycetota bacterium]